MSDILIAVNEGINSSAVFSRHGKILFAVEEEKLVRRKTPIGFPTQSVSAGMKILGLSPSEIECVLLSNLSSPDTTPERFLAAYEAPFLRGPIDTDQQIWRKMIRTLVPSSIREKRRARLNHQLSENFRNHLIGAGIGDVQMIRTHHHSNHAASAYFGLITPEDRDKSETITVTLDGGGDDSCSHVYLCQSDKMELIAETPLGHSLGNIYSRVTHLLGFKPHEHEYKLMGMAPYVSETHCREVADIFHGYLGLDPSNPMQFLRQISEPTHQIGPRLAEDLRRRRFDTIAGGLQMFTEELIKSWIAAIIAETGINRVVAAGGVFMNVKANMLIANMQEISYFDVFPSCGDETLPFGAIWQYEASRGNRNIGAPFDIYAGPSIEIDLDKALEYTSDQIIVRDSPNPVADAATRLADGEVIAWCHGPLEFGARALGNRSILAYPGNPNIVSKINQKIKNRDFWMPFAPAMTLEEAQKRLHLPSSIPVASHPSFMMHAFESREENTKIIAALHPYDRTARAQIVKPEQNQVFHDLLCEVGKKTGVSVLLNTSFNLHGYPICATTADAIHALLNSSIDAVFIGNIYIQRKS
jgi:carbamoyltransferase